MYFLLYCRVCDKNDPRFPTLVEQATQNFDTFEDFGSPLHNTRDGKHIHTSRTNLFRTLKVIFIF